VQRQEEETETSAPAAGGAGETDRSQARGPTPQQIADLVYELLRQDLRVERERLGMR
jgi:hypothetical protein